MVTQVYLEIEHYTGVIVFVKMVYIDGHAFYH